MALTHHLANRRRVLVVLLLTTVAAGGCGSSTATVTGTVRYRNQALPTGTVSFYCENGEIVSSLISANGTYHLPRVAPGPVRVAIISHSRVPEGLQVVQPPVAFAPVSPQGVRYSAVASASARPATPIPDKYSRPDSSGLLFTLSPGEQNVDIELNP